MKYIYLVYTTDVRLSFASRDVIGVCTSEAQAIKIVKAHAKKEGAKLSAEDLYNLSWIWQTQGTHEDWDWNYFIEPVEKNTLI